jgi:hypothetical protein
MIVLAYFGSQSTKFHVARWKCWLCSWPAAISRCIRQRACIQFCTNLGNCVVETLAVIKQAFGKESRKRRVHTHRDRQRRGRWRAKTRACSLFSLTWRGLFTNNSSCHTKESISYTIVTFYGECVKICDDFEPNFSDKRTGCSVTTTHRLTIPISPKSFWPKHNCCPLLTLLFCFPDWR